MKKSFKQIGTMVRRSSSVLLANQARSSSSARNQDSETGSRPASIDGPRKKPSIDSLSSTPAQETQATIDGTISEASKPTSTIPAPAPVQQPPVVELPPPPPAPVPTPPPPAPVPAPVQEPPPPPPVQEPVVEPVAPAPRPVTPPPPPPEPPVQVQPPPPTVDPSPVPSRLPTPAPRDPTPEPSLVPTVPASRASTPPPADETEVHAFQNTYVPPPPPVEPPRRLGVTAEILSSTEQDIDFDPPATPPADPPPLRSVFATAAALRGRSVTPPPPARATTPPPPTEARQSRARSMSPPLSMHERSSSKDRASPRRDSLKPSISRRPSSEILGVSALSPITEVSPAVETPPANPLRAYTPPPPPPLAAPAFPTPDLKASQIPPTQRSRDGSGSSSDARPFTRPHRSLSQAPSYQSTVETNYMYGNGYGKGKDRDEGRVVSDVEELDPEDDGFASYGATPLAVPRVQDSEGFPFFPVPDEQGPYRIKQSDQYPITTASPEPMRNMPEPMHDGDSYREPTPGPVQMPLPPLHEVMDTPHAGAAYYSSRGAGAGFRTATNSRAPSVHEVLVDERRPLLSRPISVRSGRNDVRANGDPASPSSLNFHVCGWTEYLLPDATVYYYHPKFRTTTDVNLRNDTRLKNVMSYLRGDALPVQQNGDRKKPVPLSGSLFQQSDATATPTPMTPPEGWELWLRDGGRRRLDFVPMRNWVNHTLRIVTYEPPSMDGQAWIPDDSGEDKLDVDYRYWAYMESHPAHVPLPPKAHDDALDALTWSYSDHLLKSRRASHPPFTEGECDELLKMLHSLADPKSDLQNVIHTRLVSRILLRVAQWRQHHFRPEKALPRDAHHVPRFTHYRTEYHHQRSALDIILTWLCFGIPYLFVNKQGHNRIVDEERGRSSSAGILQTIIVGASACIIAAIVLSASVTFLTLPGLDGLARTAGVIAIIGSSASLASSIIALVRHQSEVDKLAMGGEGLLTPTRGTIVLSLPGVFLAWSLIAFIVGLMLYVFRGSATVVDPHWGTKFAEQTKWATVILVGFSLGVLSISAFFARR